MPRPMSRREYLDALEQLGISQVGASKPFGMSRRQAQRHGSRETPIPQPLAKLVRLALRLKLTPAEIEQL